MAIIRDTDFAHREYYAPDEWEKPCFPDKASDEKDEILGHDGIRSHSAFHEAQEGPEGLRVLHNILGMSINPVDYGSVLSRIEDWRQNGERQYITLTNPHSVMIGLRDGTMRDAAAGAGMNLPDGVGIIWADKILGYRDAGRVTGPTLMLKLCDWGRQYGYRHFFCGGAEGTAERLSERLRNKFPGLIVAGTCCPPFRPLTEAEDQQIVDQINATRPDIVWVGLGAPKQEKWMHAHCGRIAAPALIGVGAAFDFHSGRVKWAPAWIRKVGLEWAFRLAMEPRRMWRRNLDSPLFLIRVFAQLTAGIFSNRAQERPPANAERGAMPLDGERELRRPAITSRNVLIGTILLIAALCVTFFYFGSRPASTLFSPLWKAGVGDTWQLYGKSGTFWAVLVGSFFLTTCLTPLVMGLARISGAIDRGGYRKVYQKTMPLLGGIAVAVPFFVVCGLGIAGVTGLFETMSINRLQLTAILIGGIFILGVGIVDDIRGMRVRHKFFSQVAVASFLCLCGYGIRSVSLPILGTIPLGTLFGTALTIVWIVGLTNALNIIDGLDGLASGIALISVVGLGIIASMYGSVFVVLLCVALAGSLAAFLVFNFHPARIFLGDTGSLFLGYALATMSLTSSMKASGTVIILAPILALGLPIFEVVLSMLRRFVRGLPIASADASHIHHRLIRRGFSQRRVALVMYAVGLVCLFAALFCATVSSADPVAMLIPLGMYVGAMLVIGWLAGYSRDWHNTFAIRKRNIYYQTFVNYATLGLSSDMGGLSPDSILEVARMEMRLAYLQVSFLDPAQTIGTSGRVGKANSADAQATACPEVVREIHLKAANGEHIRIRYQHAGNPEKQERLEIQRHLGRIFEHATIKRARLQAYHKPFLAKEGMAPPIGGGSVAQPPRWGTAYAEREAAAGKEYWVK